MEEARRFLSSERWALASWTREARRAEYSACQIVSIWVEFDSSGGTYGSILGGLCASALEGDSVTLVLETLGSDESLDLGGLSVGLLVALGLDLAADDELADLKISSVPNSSKLQIREFVHRRPW